MRRVLFVALVAFCLLLQISLLPGLRPFDVVPNLALVVVVLVGLESTASMALAAAVVGGLALDLSSGANLGLWTGVLILAALVTGLLHRAGVETDGPLVPGAIVIAGTLIMPVVILAGLANTVSQWPVGLLLQRFVLELMLNLILMVMVRPLIRRLAPVAPPDMAAMS